MVVDFLKYSGILLLIVIIQVYILNNAELGAFIHPQILLFFLLYLPSYVNKNWLIVIGFASGLLLDTLQNTMGINAFAAVLICFIRPLFTRNIESSKSLKESESKLWINRKGFAWKLTYLGLMTAIHHFVFFILEGWGINIFTRTIPTIVISSLFSLMMLLLLEEVIFGKAIKR